MPASATQIASGNPGRLVRRLCKHWGHKFPVETGEHHGRIELSIGVCTLHDDAPSLRVALQASSTADLARLEQVVADHLQRMASDESLVIAWQRQA